MALKSMTGFASREGTLEVAGQVYEWTWEIKAVNGKALDMRLRMPHLLQSCEPAVRKLLGKRITRGNLQASLSLEHDGNCLLYTSPSPRDQRGSRMPSSA